MKYAGILYCYNSTYLLCKRRKDVSLGGFWSVPGGQVESGETEPEAAIREFFEETQLSLNIFKLDLVDIFPARNAASEVIGSFYLYQYQGGERYEPVLDAEHIDWGYFSRKKIPMPIGSSLVKAIKEIM